jgi:ribosomal protein L3
MKTKIIQRNWQYRVHKTKTRKQKQSRETGNIGYTRRRQRKQNQSRETGNIGYTRRRQENKNNPEKLAI